MSNLFDLISGNSGKEKSISTKFGYETVTTETMTEISKIVKGEKDITHISTNCNHCNQQDGNELKEKMFKCEPLPTADDFGLIDEISDSIVKTKFKMIASSLNKLDRNSMLNHFTNVLLHMLPDAGIEPDHILVLDDIYSVVVGSGINHIPLAYTFILHEEKIRLISIDWKVLSSLFSKRDVIRIDPNELSSYKMKWISARLKRIGKYEEVSTIINSVL